MKEEIDNLNIYLDLLLYENKYVTNQSNFESFYEILKSNYIKCFDAIFLEVNIINMKISLQSSIDPDLSLGKKSIFLVNNKKGILIYPSRVKEDMYIIDIYTDFRIQKGKDGSIYIYLF